MKRDGHDRTVLGTAKGAGCEKGGRLVTLEGLQREGQLGTGILGKTPGPCAPRYAPRCGTRCARPSLYARVAPEQNIGRAAGSCTRGLPSARPAREQSVLRPAILQVRRVNNGASRPRSPQRGFGIQLLLPRGVRNC